MLFDQEHAVVPGYWRGKEYLCHAYHTMRRNRDTTSDFSQRRRSLILIYQPS